MHTGGTDSKSAIDYNGDVTGAVMSFFGDMKKKALDYGISESQLCYDCGIGFGKTRDADMALLADCGRLSSYSPLLIGVSRKRIIGHITGIEDPKDRDFASAVAAAITVSDGAGIVRVHNVAVTRQALGIVSKFERGIL
jgi:dihydropteroate synthase